MAMEHREQTVRLTFKGRAGALLALCLLYGLLLKAEAASCAERLAAVSPGFNTAWIDKDTPPDACTLTKCRENYTDCMGAKGWPQPYTPRFAPPRTEDMVLVFSDEFESPWRDFGPGRDARWQALDLLYVNGDEAMFRREQVTVKGGKAIITAEKKHSQGPFSALWGDQLAEKYYSSGMLQGWNKFCFTGGYLEVSVKLPGDNILGGLWPAVFTMGNLARAGYMRSTEGLWPFSYDACDENALVAPGNWTEHKGQRINRCNSTIGRGSQEIDLLEVGVWEPYSPKLSTSMQIAPLLPPGLHWLDNEGAMYFPTYSDPTLHSTPNGWAGINSYMRGDANGTYKFMPRPGTTLADALSAIHDLNATHFTQFYTYGFDWVPNKYIRWYINNKLIFEMNALALKGGTNGANQTVADRMIPVEPAYININLAMSNSFALISPDLPLPARMEIDWVRVYQYKDMLDIGCDTEKFPSQQYIMSRVNDYNITLEGWEDFVGNSSVMGPTMQAPPPSGLDDPKIRAAVIASCVGGSLLLIAAIVGFFVYKRWKRNKDLRAQGIDPETAFPKKPLTWENVNASVKDGCAAAWAWTKDTSIVFWRWLKHKGKLCCTGGGVEVRHEVKEAKVTVRPVTPPPVYVNGAKVHPVVYGEEQAGQAKGPVQPSQPSQPQFFQQQYFPASTVQPVVPQQSFKPYHNAKGQGVSPEVVLSMRVQGR